MGRSLYEWKDNKTRFRNRSIKCIKQRKNRLKKYDVNVTEKGVTDTLKGETGATAQIPEAWKANVINIVDTVPIPKGFVASSATGENTKNGGLVIYEGTESVTDSNVEDAKRTRNQYVWVPVEDFSKFIRQNFGGTDKLINTIENVEHMDNWEVTLNETTNMPLPTQDENYFTQTTLKEVQAMYSSVKEYKGFYIARYEIGLDIGSHKTEDDGEIIKTVHSKMNKAPYNYVRWAYNNVTNEDTNGAVEISRSIYPEANSNYGVTSILTYAVQWDRTLAWWVETKAQNGTKDVTIASNTDLNNSEKYGNYKNNEIQKSTFNTGAKYLLNENYKLATTYLDVTSNKSSGASWLLTTGATEETRVNNIYDIAGNLWEWTMEFRLQGTIIEEYRQMDFLRCYRGSGCDAHGSYNVFSRLPMSQNAGMDHIGFRSALYIKQ